MQIETISTDKATVLELKGRMDAASVSAFDGAFNNLIESGVRKFVLDLGGLEYISSAGLRSVLTAGKKTKAQQGTLVLCNVTGLVKEVFDISGFASLFTMYDSREAALAAL